MSANEPSEERIERAYHAGRLARLRASSNAKADPDYRLSEGERIFMRAALTADAPALIEARIAGMRGAVTILLQWIHHVDHNQAVTWATGAIEARAAALQAELDKERGNG